MIESKRMRKRKNTSCLPEFQTQTEMSRKELDVNRVKLFISYYYYKKKKKQEKECEKEKIK